MLRFVWSRNLAVSWDGVWSWHGGEKSRIGRVGGWVDGWYIGVCLSINIAIIDGLECSVDFFFGFVVTGLMGKYGL